MEKIIVYTETGCTPNEKFGSPCIWIKRRTGETMTWNTEQEALAFATEECLGTFVIVPILGRFIIVENFLK